MSTKFDGHRIKEAFSRVKRIENYGTIIMVLLCIAVITVASFIIESTTGNNPISNTDDARYIFSVIFLVLAVFALLYLIGSYGYRSDAISKAWTRVKEMKELL